jgi:hypothetical protein
MGQWVSGYRECKGTSHVAGACRLNEANKIIEPFSKYMSESNRLDGKPKSSLPVLHPKVPLDCKK